MPTTWSQLSSRFPTTHWGMVAHATGFDPAVRREAMGRLLTAYLPAFRAHLVFQKRIPPDKAEDLAQSFACDRIVQDGLLARAQEGKGRLRNFLLKALERHALMARRHELAQCRSPGEPAADVDDAAGVECPLPDASAAFDAAWARGVVGRAVEAMRLHCADSGKEKTWLVFELRVSAPALRGEAPVPYEQISHQCGFASALEAANMLVTAKRMFTRFLRAVIAEYADGEDILSELLELRAILSTGRGGGAAYQP